MNRSEFQQYYPTYSFKERDVVLTEFEEAQKIANTQSKLYGQLANFLIAFVTVGITLLLKTADNPNSEAISALKENILLLDIFLAIITLVILRYFIEIQRTVVINSRKVVTLRKMLGLNYGNLQLTIPNWRVEGATNPFVIKLFPGWFKFGSSPFWTLILALNILWYLSVPSIRNSWIDLNWWIISLLVTGIYAIIFRAQLNENHESIYLSIIKGLSGLLRIKLVHNFEYVLYRAKLSVHEKQRLKFDTKNLEEVLILIEDKRFHSHNGIDIKSIIRSIFSQSTIYRRKHGLLKSGGSTITMQLCRTLFIPPNQNPIKRKMVELLLAFWFEQQFSKKEVISFYLCSVRFERSVNGIMEASKYFFSSPKKRFFSKEESFFLIERLSNISSSYRPDRIKTLYNKLTPTLELSNKTIENIYLYQEKIGRITRKS